MELSVSPVVPTVSFSEPITTGFVLFSPSCSEKPWEKDSSCSGSCDVCWSVRVSV